MTDGPDARNDPTLLAWLADRDVPCPLCGYNLRGLIALRCPECGHDLRLAVALLLPAGLGLLRFPVVAREGLPRGREVDYMACVPLAAVVLVNRRRVQRWPRGRQKVIAATAAVLTSASFAWLLVSILSR